MAEGRWVVWVGGLKEKGLSQLCSVVKSAERLRKGGGWMVKDKKSVWAEFN